MMMRMARPMTWLPVLAMPATRRTATTARHHAVSSIHQFVVPALTRRVTSRLNCRRRRSRGHRIESSIESGDIETSFRPDQRMHDVQRIRSPRREIRQSTRRLSCARRVHRRLIPRCRYGRRRGQIGDGRSQRKSGTVAAAAGRRWSTLGESHLLIRTRSRPTTRRFGRLTHTRRWSR